MPEAMGVMPLIEPPDGRGGRWGLLLPECTLEAFDGRGADLQLMLILQIPREPLRTKRRFGCDYLAETLCCFCGQASRLRPRGSSFWNTREGQALPYPLNRPWTGRLRSAALLDLRCTPGGMALAQGSNPLFGGEGKSVMGPLRTAWVILQGLAESGKRPMAELVQITATDPRLCCDLGERDPAEEG